jgi:hypothetical protein
VADSTKGELVQNSGDFKYITACQTPEGMALLVCIATGGGPLPFGSWAGSGTLVGALNGSFGYAADVPNALATALIEKPRNVSTANATLGITVTDNTFTNAVTTTFTVYKNGAPTLQTITFLGGVLGLVQNSGVFPFNDTDTFDLRVENPGGAAEVGKVISFGWSIDFF